MPELSAATTIDAPPAVVWAVLLDVDRYGEWNTLLSLSARPRAGERVRARLSLPGLPTVAFSPRVTVCDPRRELRWESRLLGHDTEHAFLLEPSGDGTRFVQEETLAGPLAGPVTRRLDRRLVRGFEAMNAGLKRRAERVAADR